MLEKCGKTLHNAINKELVDRDFNTSQMNALAFR